MKVLVLGYYNRANLGDEMFKLTIPKLLPDTSLTFICVDDFDGKYEDYDAIVCGGGDIVNDYFHHKFTRLLVGFNGPIFGLGIGIPYQGLIRKGYMDMYDHVFIREKTDLMAVQRRLGSQYAHYLPDLGFALDFKSSKISETKISGSKKSGSKTRKIGVFLAQSLYKHEKIIYSLSQFIHKLSLDYEVTLYRFNTSSSIVEDDKYINSYISTLCPQVKIDDTIYDVYQMLSVMDSLDYGVCMRFHSHIFATIAGLPFISIYSTRKVELYITEEEYGKWACPIELDDGGNPLRLDSDKAFETFQRVVEDTGNIRDKLRYIRNQYKFLLDTPQVMNLLKDCGKRPRLLDPIERIDIDKIYNECSNILRNEAGYDPSEECYDIPIEVATKVATLLCMNVTGMPSSRYLYGTIKNITQKPHDLKEMIKWIYKDFSSNYLQVCPRIYLDNYCQDTFRGIHRAGWQYVIDHMRSMNVFNGVICDMYIDLSFLWGKRCLKSKGIIPYTSPWIGFVHHCPNEEYTEHNTVKLIQDPDFQRSLVSCKGIICLSTYLAEWFRGKLGDRVPIHVIKHPTIIPDIKFNKHNFLSNPCKKLINVGAWYRNPFSIHRIDPNIFTKCSLTGKEMSNYFCPDELYFTMKDVRENKASNKWVYYMFEYINTLNLHDIDDTVVMNINDTVVRNIDDSQGLDKKLCLALIKHLQDIRASVTLLEYLTDDEYDKIFSENVVFLHLIDASAANTVIECIVRNTPIVINRLPATVEYLGESYPLFYDDIDDIKELLTIDNIIQAHEYLRAMNVKDLSIEEFMKAFQDPKIYGTLI